MPNAWPAGGIAAIPNGSITVAKLAPSVLPTRVTSLTPGQGGMPAVLTDGMEVHYAADATNGIIWHLRYNAGSASAYKWEFLGGPGLYSYVYNNSVVNTAGWGDFGGPNVTVPVAGDFEVTLGGRGFNDISGGGSDMIQSYTVGGSVPLAQDGNDLYTPGVSIAIPCFIASIKTGIPANTLIAERCQANAGNAGITARSLRVVPRRVG